MSSSVPPSIPLALSHAYFAKFHRPIPQFISQGDDLGRRIHAEAIKALAGERGSLDPEEFAVECPPGAEL